MTNILKITNEAIAFANINSIELAKEIIEWQDEGTLCQGKLRELAIILTKVDDEKSLRIAESYVTRACLRELVFYDTIFG